MPLNEADMAAEIEAALKEIENGEVLSQDEVEYMVKQWQQEK